MKIPLSFVFLLSAYLCSSQASIYSVVNSATIIAGTTDCWLVNYSIYHNNNTISITSDDVLLHTKNTAVGTDCPPTLAPQTNDILPHSNATNLGDYLGDYSIYPNPVIDELLVRFNVASDARNWKWFIASVVDGHILITGRSDGSGDLRIDVSQLNKGRYVFSLVDDNGNYRNSEFVVIN